MNGIKGIFGNKRELLVLAVAAGLFLSFAQLPVFASSSSSASTCKPDFTLALTPTGVTVQRGGSSKTIQVTMTGLCSFHGDINVGVRGVTPQPTGSCNKQGVCTSNGPLFHQIRYDIPLNANSVASVPISVSATQSTLATTYQIMVSGENIQGGCCYGITHTANFTLTVT